MTPDVDAKPAISTSAVPMTGISAATPGNGVVAVIPTAPRVMSTSPATPSTPASAWLGSSRRWQQTRRTPRCRTPRPGTSGSRTRSPAGSCSGAGRYPARRTRSRTGRTTARSRRATTPPRPGAGTDAVRADRKGNARRRGPRGPPGRTAPQDGHRAQALDVGTMRERHPTRSRIGCSEGEIRRERS